MASRIVTMPKRLNLGSDFAVTVFSMVMGESSEVTNAAGIGFVVDLAWGEINLSNFLM